MLTKHIKKTASLGLLVMIIVCGHYRCGSQNSASDVDVQTWAEQTMSGMSLEEKIGQLICTDITADYITEDDPRFQNWVSLARDHGIGGFVLYGGTPRDVAHILNRLQSKAELPLLISADFEGGPGQQITGASEFPANMAFTAAGSEELMYRAASLGGIEGRAMGIHLTYTPVVDISVRPENPSESVRSFGGDLDLLGRLVKVYVKGYHDSGMLTTAKHFPGRGDIEVFPEFPEFRFINKSAAMVEDQEVKTQLSGALNRTLKSRCESLRATTEARHAKEELRGLAWELDQLTGHALETISTEMMEGAPKMLCKCAFMYCQCGAQYR